MVRLVGTALFEGLAAPPNGAAFYDGVEFEQLARNLVMNGRFAIGDGPLTSFRAPAMPFLLAAVYVVAGIGNFVAAHLVQSVVGALVVVPTYALARALHERFTAIVAGGLVAVVPNVAYYSIHFSSEPLHTLFLVFSVAALAGAMSRGRLVLAALAGATLGVAALARPIAAYFPPFYAVALLLAWPWRQALQPVVALFAGTLLVVLPWSARNYRVHHRWLLLASNGGSTFWGSNNDIVARDPRLRGEWISTRILRGRDARIDTVPNEVDRDRLEFGEGKRWILSHRREAAVLALWKVTKLWSPFPRSSNRTFVYGTALGYLLYAPLMLPGAALMYRKDEQSRRLLALMLAPIAATVASTVVFYGTPRFRAPIDPFLIIMAAYAYTLLLRRVRTAASTGA